MMGVLQADGQYEWGDRSPSFPGIPIGKIGKFLQMARTKGHMLVLREFRKWVRKQLAKK